MSPELIDGPTLLRIVAVALGAWAAMLILAHRARPRP